MILLSIVHTSVCTFSSCSNLFLLYLIINNTPKHLKSYAAMLITLCIYELITSISSFIVFPRIVPLGFEGIACVYNGPCAYLDSHYTCLLIYTIVLHGFTMYNIQMTANFCFRYYVLKRADPGVGRVVAVNLLLLLPTVISACCFVFSEAPEAEVRALIARYTPYDFSQMRLIGLTGLTHSWALPSICLIVTTALPCTLVNVIVGSAVSRFLHANSTRFSTKTRATHDSFLKVLTFQAAVSQAFLIAVSCYVAGQLDIVRSPLQEYATHMDDEFGSAFRVLSRLSDRQESTRNEETYSGTMIGDCCIVSSPLLTMFYVRPYRRRIALLLRNPTCKIFSLSVWTKGLAKVSEKSTTIVVVKNHSQH